MPADTPQDALTAALLDSRGRWRDLALLAADLLFETDAEGRFTFLAPDLVLGHPAEALMGSHAAALLAEPAGDPFRAGAPMRGTRLWLRQAAGEPLCLEFTAMPREGGLRGAARDVTAEERRREVTARALRRGTALGRLLGAALGSRGEGSAEAALGKLLAGLLPALGCAGAALLQPRRGRWHLATALGADAAPVLASLPPPGGPRPAPGIALIPTGLDLSLLAWRAHPFDPDEQGLLATLAPSLAALHAEAERQRALDAAAHTDALTGLLNRRGFLAALEERLAAGARGVVAYLDLDGLKPLNDVHGHAAGDAALCALAARLRDGTRRIDLAARLGGDEFAVWLEGLDPLVAASRAAPFADAGPLAGWPQAGAHAVRASLGLAAAEPGEGADALLARADAAMYRVKHGRKAA